MGGEGKGRKGKGRKMEGGKEGRREGITNYKNKPKHSCPAHIHQAPPLRGRKALFVCPHVPKAHGE